MKFVFNRRLFASLFLFFYVFLGVGVMLTLLCYKKSVLLHIIFFELNSVYINFPVIFDWRRVIFRVLVCFISSCVMIFSKSYMSADPFLSRFIWIVILFVLSMNLLIFIPNLISLLLGWDGLGLVSFCLVIYYQNPKSLGAGLITAFINRIGDVGILIGIGWMFRQGHWDRRFVWKFDIRYMRVAMILLAGITKSAQIPFCRWLPAAIAAPTPVSALVHSSTLVTAGVFLLIRFFPFLRNFILFKPSILFISVVTMLIAGIAANFETDLKKIIALSTLRQLGVIIIRIGIGYPDLALVHLFTHALFKALLFLCAGGIIHLHNNNQDIRKMSQLWKHLPVTRTCFNIANLALCGIPFFAGFYSKDYIIEIIIFNQINLVSGILVFLATFLTVLYSLRLSISVFWRRITQVPYLCNRDEDIFILLSLLILTRGAIVGGASLFWLIISPSWVPVFRLFDKLLILCLTLISVLLRGPVFRGLFYKNKVPIVDFFSYIWFISLLRNNFVRIPILKLGYNSFKILDLGWLEVFRGEGIFNFLINCSKNNQKNQGNFFNSIIRLRIITIMAFPFFFYFF